MLRFTEGCRNVESKRSICRTQSELVGSVRDIQLVEKFRASVLHMAILLRENVLHKIDRSCLCSIVRSFSDCAQYLWNKRSILIQYFSFVWLNLLFLNNNGEYSDFCLYLFCSTSFNCKLIRLAIRLRYLCTIFSIKT